MQDQQHNRSHRAHVLPAVLAGVLATLMLLAAPAHAAAPANDNFESPQLIEGESGTVPGTNVDATRQAGEPYHADDGGASVWYRWTAPSNGRVTFDTCDGRTFDTTLAIYSGSALTALSQLAENDDDCGLGSRVSVNVSAGTVYHVAVDGFAGDTGNFNLRWQLGAAPPPPANDAFSAARTLSGVRGRLLGTTVGATGETGEPGWLRNSSVWYRWRAPRTMPIEFHTCGAASFDTLLGVYRGTSVSALRPLVVNDDACGLRSRVRLMAQNGQVYNIAVGAFSEPGTFELRWEPSPCIVPNLRGQTLARARTTLANRGCRTGLVRYVPSPIVPRGVVVSQWPAPRTRLPYQGQVRLAVSSGSRR